MNAFGFAEALKNAQQVRKFTMSEDEFYKIRYNCFCTDGVDVHFPPDNATDAQKLLWCDLVGPMDCEKRALMLTRIGDALAFGDYWGLTVGQGWREDEGAFENSRMESLGFAGTIELTLRAAKHAYEGSLVCGNEQRFTDIIKDECDMWQRILDKYMVSAMPEEQGQVQEAGRIYEATQNQRAALEATGSAMGLVRGDYDKGWNRI